MLAKPGDGNPVAPPPVAEDAVAAVFARAAELDLERSPGAPQAELDEEALVEIGAAVGLSSQAVRQAVAEHHAGALARETPRSSWLGPSLAVAERRIDADPARLRRSIECDLHRQWFRKVRDLDERSVWCARTDLAARVARRVDFRHRLVLQDVSGVVATTVGCAETGVVVRLEADLAEWRNGLGWAVAGATTAGATAGAVLAAVATVDPAPLLALSAAGLGGGGGVVAARRVYGGGVRRLTEGLEGMLDRLERAGR